MKKDFSIGITSYFGHEDEIRTIINANRGKIRSKAYLDWRYLGENCGREPCIFWVRKHTNNIGIASLIPRRYHYGNELDVIYVLGDIAVNQNYRKKGIGTKLFKYMNRHIDSQLKKQALVIPNEAAKNALQKINWSTPHPFVWGVWIAKPSIKILKMRDNDIQHNFIDQWVNRARIKWLERFVSGKSELVPCHAFDAEFDQLWQYLDKKDSISRVRSAATLRWRFDDHPEHRFQVRKLMKNSALVGYVVFKSDCEHVCRVMDLAAVTAELLREMISLLLIEIVTKNSDILVRMKLHADRHTIKYMKSIGFFFKTESDVFQIYGNENKPEQKHYRWYLTAADKDV